MNLCVTEKAPGAVSEKDARSPESREQPSADSPDGTDDAPSGSSKGNKKPQSDSPPKGHFLRRYTPKTTEEELHQIQKVYPLIFSLLFWFIFVCLDKIN